MQSALQPSAEVMAEMVSRIVVPSLANALAPLVEMFETTLPRFALAYQEHAATVMAGFALGIQAAIDNSQIDYLSQSATIQAAAAVAVAVTPTVEAGTALDCILSRAERANDQLDRAFYAAIGLFILWYWKSAVTNNQTNDVFQATIAALLLLQHHWDAARRKAS
ncbi:MAG: hypothetical protein QOK43_1979 [Acidimicrobiaceae bacterium]|nr:hypothetical protein [Acidimicrobiaceae bacterium]